MGIVSQNWGTPEMLDLSISHFLRLPLFRRNQFLSNPLSTQVKLAIACAGIPLTVGTSIDVLWRLTYSRDLEWTGIWMILMGTLLYFHRTASGWSCENFRRQETSACQIQPEREIIQSVNRSGRLGALVILHTSSGCLYANGVSCIAIGVKTGHERGALKGN